jgi:hypothetical protein
LEQALTYSKSQLPSARSWPLPGKCILFSMLHTYNCSFILVVHPSIFSIF